MKPSTLTLLLSAVLAMTVICSASSQPYFDKDGTSSTVRRSYLSSQYGLSKTQIDAYEAALFDKTQKSIVHFNKEQPREEWRTGHIALCKKFKEDVRGIMTEVQYAKWLYDTKNGGDQIRRYRENLNIETDDRLNKMLTAINTCKKRLSELAKQEMPTREKTPLQRQAVDKRNAQLVELFGAERASELIYYIDLEDKAAFVRTYFPNFSYGLSYVVGKNYLVFTYSVRKADESNADRKTVIAERHSAHEKLLADMKSTLTSDKYAQWHAYHFRYHDHNIKTAYRMTDAQYDIYMDILNDRAIERLAVGKSNISGDRKVHKLDSIDLVAYDRMANEISDHCAEMWRKDNCRAQ